MKKKVCIILIVAFAALLSTNVYFIFDHYRQEELYDSLADLEKFKSQDFWQELLYTEEQMFANAFSEVFEYFS